MPSQKLQNDSIYARVLNERGGSSLFRQELIREIQARKPDTRVITYISKYGHPAAAINPDDTKPIDDLLRSIGKITNLELLLHSSGGFSENAKKIVKMCRAYCEHLTVVVPDAAKSAATILALGADRIIMSDSSELGPIDPQFVMPTPQGMQLVPAWTIVRGFEEVIKDAVDQDGKIKIAYIPILSGIDIAKIKEAREALENAKRIAEEFLKSGMLREEQVKAESTARALAQGEKYTLHAHLIDWKEAKELLGDAVEYVKPDDEDWKLYWELYVRSAAFLENPQLVKLFESEGNSINISSMVR